MNRLELAALAAALAEQTGEEIEGTISDERLHEALTTGPGFTTGEKRLLWLSPDVRAAYFHVRRAVDREIAARLRAAGYGDELRLKAASGGEDVQTIRGHGYVLTIFRDEAPEEEWSLSIELDAALRRILPPRAAVKLFDRGGLTWVEGIPDEAGQIGALWEHAGETPIDRAARYGLVLGT